MPQGGSQASKSPAPGNRIQAYLRLAPSLDPEPLMGIATFRRLMAEPPGRATGHPERGTSRIGIPSRKFFLLRSRS